jgi:hypothetical protein
MCTVTILPGADRLRIAVNRDESNERTAARAPEVHRLGERPALMPLDPDSGGTWVAVSDTGLVLLLLNRNDAADSRDPRPRRSRGGIIPALLRGSSIGDIDPAVYPPFRLLVIRDGALEEIVSDGRGLRSPGRQPIRDPLMFTSSGLGDGLAGRFRGELFGDFFYRGVRGAAAPDDVLAMLQDEFHRHQWPFLPHLSVRMRRADARTVSTTVVELDRRRVVMSYVADPGEAAGRAVVSRLTLRRETGRRGNRRAAGPVAA